MNFSRYGVRGPAVAAVLASFVVACGQVMAQDVPSAQPTKPAAARQARKPADPAVAQARREKAFMRLDANNDGFIDRGEIDKALTASQERRAKSGRPIKTALSERSQHMLARYDANHDGKISKEEFMVRGGKGRPRGLPKSAT